MRVLVTGCTGFTGRYVAEALQLAGHEAVDPEADGAAFDLTQPDSIGAALAAARPDAIVHLAARSFVGDGDAAGFYAVNAVGTTQLLDQVLASGRSLHRIVVASSANVYGNATVEPIVEATPAAPVNHYAASKLAMEAMVRSYADRLPIVMTRPFNYTGVGQSVRFLVPKIVDHFVQRRAVIELGNLDVVRDFSDVRTVAESYVRLLSADVPGGVTNLCSGVGRSLRWILDELLAISGHHIEVRVSPALVRASEVHRLVGSSARMTEALGELPHRDFGDTLRWMWHAASSSGPDCGETGNQLR